MFYDLNSFLTYSDEDMREYERMTNDELIRMCIARFVAFFAIVGIFAVIGIGIMLLQYCKW